MRGTTGLPFLDAAMREIEATGYSCHVGRETSAWFLICDLGLDWRMGAEWFESVLIDYEPAANWFCWVFVCLIRATGGNWSREIGQPELRPLTRVQTVEVVFLSAQHDPDGTYIKRWVPELRCLPDGLPVREPWRSFEEPVMALASKSQGRDSARSEAGPDRIQMARRTLTSGGPSVAVWWKCSRTVSRQAPAGSKWPSAYPMPMLPPSSFFDIEKVAEKARRQQRQKKARVDVLRNTLRGPRYNADGVSHVPDTIQESASNDSEGSEKNFAYEALRQDQSNRRSGHNDKSSKWTRGYRQTDHCISAGTSYYGSNQAWQNQENARTEQDVLHEGTDVAGKTRRWGKAQREECIS